MNRLKLIAAVLLLIAAAVVCFSQFGVDHLGPLAGAAVILVAARRIRPSFRWVCLALPLVTLALLVVDAFVLRHRVAVAVRIWTPLMGDGRIEDTFTSPSGRTTVYLSGDHWLDTCYSAYISDGGLFPRHGYIATNAENARYPRDLTAGWNGDVFTASEQFTALRYTESSRKLETFVK